MLRPFRLLRPLFALVTLLALLPSNPLLPRVAVAATSTLASLPRKCGSGLPAGATDAACCMFGYVFADGQPVANAVVEVSNQRTNGVLTVATTSGADSTAPYYGVSLSEPPLSAVPGDVLTIKALYSSHFTSVQHTVLSDGQQVDVVIAKQAAPDYVFERQFREQMAPGQFGLFKNDVAIDGAGLVYVADYANARIQVFTRDGTFVRQWGTYGAAPGQMVTPAGVIVDQLGYVYVADYGAEEIHKFTSAGTWIATWGDFNGGDNQLVFPTDLAVDADGYIYFVEQGGQGGPRSISRIQKRTRDGEIVKVWGTVGTAPGQLNGPEGITVGPDGLLYVADTDNSRVQVFTREGVFVRQWNGADTSAGALDKPERIVAAPDGRIFVSDTGNQRIVVFSATGALVQQWDGQGTGDSAPLLPQGIALDADNAVYVIDNYNYRVQVFSSAGVFSRHWGGTGYPDNYLAAPAGMTRDNAGNIYIVDNSQALVRKYDSTGVHIADLGQRFDSGPSGLYFPYGIATNGTSELYIVDKDNARIQVFSLTGVPLRRWGSPGSGTGQFNQPYGIALDTSGNVYVADAGNNRVQKFTSQGTFVWSQSGTGSNSLGFPVGVAISLDGSTVYVTDTNNDRVQMLKASNGAVIGQFGSSGKEANQFDTPAGIAVAPDGALLIADKGNYRLLRLAPDGTPLNVYGYPGAGAGELDLPTTVLALPDGGVVVGERELSRVQFLHPLSFTRPIATIVAASPLTVQSGTTVTLHGLGSDSNAGGTIVRYIWTLDGTTVATTADATVATTSLSIGSHTIGFQVQNDRAQTSDVQTVTLSVVSGSSQNTEQKPHSWTFMLYLSGDNPNTTPYLNADSSLGALYRLLHTSSNSYVTVVALFDGDKSGGGDTFRYTLRPNQQPVVENLPEADMGDPQTLVDFVHWGQQQAPADAYYLAIADHGNALDGTSWDYTSNPDRSERLTPNKLQQALAQITDGGARPLDVLHLDSCLMGSVEIAYQLRGQARYLISSENLAWSAFAYDQYLSLVSDGTTAQQLATNIVDRYTKLVSSQHLPFTIAAVNLEQVPSLAEALNSLSGELLRYAQASESNRTVLESIRQRVQLLDSDGDGQLTASDEYIDLGDWLVNVQQTISDTQVQQAASATSSALGTTIVAEHHASGSSINLDNVHGLSIYYPPKPGARTYQTYRTSLSFADATLWDELLQAGLSALSSVSDPGPNPIAPLPFSAKYQVFLPLVRK